jgi:hypothetical protein
MGDQQTLWGEEQEEQKELNEQEKREGQGNLAEQEKHQVQA